MVCSIRQSEARLSDCHGGRFLHGGSRGGASQYAKLEIFNTDQGVQFTGAAFTGLLLENKVAISMDGRESWRDNVFVERLWRSVNTSRCICGLTTASAMRVPRSDGTWP